MEIGYFMQNFGAACDELKTLVGPQAYETLGRIVREASLIGLCGFSAFANLMAKKEGIRNYVSGLTPVERENYFNSLDPIRRGITERVCGSLVSKRLDGSLDNK